MAQGDSAPLARGLLPGTRLGRYTIVDRIGRGGMAEVFLARHDGLSGFAKTVALKVIHDDLVDDPAHIRMLLEEARLAATLDHPNVVQVFDVGADRREHYLTMEYVHGRDLRQILRELAGRTRIPLLLALAIVQDIARALHFAHTRTSPDGRPLGIVHRDVSPSNVLVSFAGAVKLTDFGIAKVSAHTAHTRTGTFKGKFGYMSPEQYLQQPLDARSDVFSLGVVLYEITTGRRAFAGENPFGAMNKAIEGDYVDPTRIVPEYPPALAEIVARALAPEPDDRYGDAATLGDDVERLARALGGPATHEELATWIVGLFGDTALPDVSQITAPHETEARSTIVVRSHARRRPLLLVGLAAAVAGAVGWQAGRSTPQETAPIEQPTRDAIAPAASIVPVTTPVEPRIELAAQRETPPAVPATVKSTRASAKPSKRSAKKSSTPPASSPPSTLERFLPPSAK
ncbi:MAG TPA: serine/threonine-protein kinase [Nannocystaceae bacterium]|nr:serine/threonine-protein kinase [Nannocystaceae bacterium]